MDSILCLESEIRKAQTNKEIVVAVFFDVEKAYLCISSCGKKACKSNWISESGREDV